MTYGEIGSMYVFAVISKDNFNFYVHFFLAMMWCECGEIVRFYFVELFLM